MSYNNFLNNKTLKSADDLAEFSILDMQNRDSNDYFFNKSDLEKMDHFKRLIERYKLCPLSKTKKVYFYFNTGSNLWAEERSDDSMINRICEETGEILIPEKKHVLNILFKLQEPLEKKKKDKTINEMESEKLNEITTAIKEFNKFIDKTIKEHQKTKFARSIISFFNHQITDPEFMEKININNQHLLPLKRMNYNLRTMKIEQRTKEQYFTKCLDIDDFDEISEHDDNFKTVDKFFNDICSNHKPKKDYLQKILGYFLSGAVPLGRCFFIFYGQGRNGKSALIEIVQGIMGSFYCKSVESSILIKRGVKNSGQASPELEALDYGTRLAVISETDEGDKLNESLIKQVTGGDPINYRALFGDPKEIRSEAKLCMLTNNKPHFNADMKSMTDRLRFIDFKSRFLNESELVNENAYNEDKTLKEFYYKAEPELIKELKTTLKKYVLLWMIIGAKKFFDDEHLNIPDDEILKFENLSYLNELDSVQRFIDECCIVGKDEKELVSTVKEHYNKFCVDESIPALKPSKLKDTLTRRFEVKKDNNNYYYGFKIKPVENIHYDLDDEY
jgi:putative DNA primase/helicase